MFEESTMAPAPGNSKGSRYYVAMPTDVWLIISTFTAIADLKSVLFLNKEIQLRILTAWRTPKEFENITKPFFNEVDFQKKDHVETFAQILKLFVDYGFFYPIIDEDQAEQIFSSFASSSMSLESAMLSMVSVQFNPNSVWRNWCAGGAIDVVEFLIDNNYIEISSKEYVAALSKACSSDQIPMVEYLLSLDYKIPLRYQSRLFLLAKTEPTKTKFYKLLLKDPRIHIETYGHLLLQECVINNRTELFETLLKDARVDPTHNNNFVLEASSHLGYDGIVKAILVDGRCEPEPSVLLSSVESGFISIVRILLEDGRVHVPDDCLFDAATLGYYDIVRLLLKDGRVGGLERAAVGAAIAKHFDIVRLIKSYQI